jgi:hypothetical protein
MNGLPAAVLVCVASTLVLASPAQRAATKATRGPRVSTDAICAADLGAGVTSHRRFCDVIIASKAAESIAVRIPAHRGTAKLTFDLHNRIAVPPEDRPMPQTFASNTAIAAVIGPKSELARAAASSEFRTTADLFDRLGGGPGGGPKTVAPGPAAPVSVTIPAGIASIGIVGVRLEVLTRLGKQAYDTPGRPVGMVSNIRVEFTPR